MRKRGRPPSLGYNNSGPGAFQASGRSDSSGSASAVTPAYHSAGPNGCGGGLVHDPDLTQNVRRRRPTGSAPVTEVEIRPVLGIRQVTGSGPTDGSILSPDLSRGSLNSGFTCRPPEGDTRLTQEDRGLRPQLPGCGPPDPATGGYTCPVSSCSLRVPIAPELPSLTRRDGSGVKRRNGAAREILCQFGSRPSELTVATRLKSPVFERHCPPRW
jgi:hypothetical protein